MTQSEFLLLVGYALGLATFIPLALTLRGRYKAAAYAQGYRSGRAEREGRVEALQAEVGRQQRAREIEHYHYQQQIEAMEQDRDERIAAYARRCNPLTAADLATLHAISKALGLAATTYRGLHATAQADAVRPLQVQAQDIAARLQVAMQHEQPSTASTASTATPAQEAAA